jgi:hypothetical protein
VSCASLEGQTYEIGDRVYVLTGKASDKIIIGKVPKSKTY